MTLQQLALDELNLPAVLHTVSTYCMTEMGAAVTQQLSPVDDVAVLETTLEQVQEAVNILLSTDVVPIERFADIRPLVQRARIVGNYLSAPDLLNVHDALGTSRSVRRFLVERDQTVSALRALADQLVDDRILEKHIADAIDETGLVRDSASRELLSIRREIHSLEARLRSRLHRILKKLGEEELLQDDFVTQRDGRFVLPIQVQNKRLVEGIIHGVSQTGQTVFLEPTETFELNNELSLLRGREQREIINILTTLTAEVGSVSSVLEGATDVLVELDSIFARARYAIEYGGLKPTIVDEDEVELTNVRHPILVHQARRSQRKGLSEALAEIVPLSVRIGGSARGILISGPNAGGKTVAMKTMGLTLAMTYCGVFPLGTCVCPVRRLYTSIGDHQSIDANLSTFSSQIIRLRDILSELDRHALVLIDEICAGTDPAEGGALAAGILDSILERGACFVVTTHQSSLKQYALTREHITNASLAFDETRMMPTFRFLYGVPGNSYAFDLSKSVGLPEVVLTRAKSYLGHRHDELEESISAMQRFREEAEQMKSEAAADRAAAQKARADYEERLAQIKVKRTSSLEEARTQAAEILGSANALIENTIREIREQQKSAAEIKREFEQGKEQLIRPTATQQEQEGSQKPASLQIGDVVRVKDTVTSGTILTIDEKGHAVVDVHGITMRVDIAKLEAEATSPVPKKKTEHHPQSTPKRTQVDHSVRDTSLTLDIRGLRADEALQRLTVFYDNAVMRSAPFISIIHGKGTGALREVVHQFLERQPSHATFRLGTIPEGGDGITIVDL